ncbi:hypothetical protein [Desulfovibrio sp. TomC]|uniref:hypothetical protein n=1 Tax=Desulfovibrio sp. TomC TaxID=1562888 RepID=UPI000574A463|nr:hypothetical protein [Desulfovibrio sp. TomC]KHK02332.1 hypothetical protein NY78_2090 [Desulfovibrio sp. TomC]
MNEAGLTRLRELLGWIAAAFCLCAALALADSFVNSFHTGPNTFSVLVGGEESLSGPLPVEAADATAMVAVIDHPGLSFSITTQAQGFWMGNRMWLGTLKVAPDAKPGTATVVLRNPGGEANTPVQAFVIHIYPDRAALNAASNSQSLRLLGLTPMSVAAYCLIAACLVGLCVYLTTRRLEAIWTRLGKAVVYMTKKTPDGLLISFGLGSDQGLAIGSSVAVHDQSGLPVAMASVMRCSPDDAAALVVGDGKVSLGNLVSIAPPAGG